MKAPHTFFSLVILLCFNSIGVFGQVSAGMSLAVEVIPAKRIEAKLTYAAKFICGKIQTVPEPIVSQLGTGAYLTAVNIYNPHSHPVIFTKRGVETKPQDEKRGNVGEPQTETLQANQGLEVNCKNIQVLLGFDPCAPPLLSRALL